MLTSKRLGLFAALIFVTLGLVASIYSRRNEVDVAATPEPVAARAARKAPTTAPKPPVVQPHPLQSAIVRIAGVEQAAVAGSVRLIGRETGGVAIDYRLENLPPGPYVLAVHTGDGCPEVDTATTGEEIGQVIANVMGRARGKLVDDSLTLGREDADGTGRVLVVHEGDLAGRGLGCGVLAGS